MAVYNYIVLQCKKEPFYIEQIQTYVSYSTSQVRNKQSFRLASLTQQHAQIKNVKHILIVQSIIFCNQLPRPFNYNLANIMGILVIEINKNSLTHKFVIILKTPQLIVHLLGKQWLALNNDMWQWE
jgi:hypothetical protein